MADRMIRNLDPDIYNRAQGQAKARGYKRFGDYVNEALELKLSLPPHESHFQITPENGIEVRIVRKDGSELMFSKDGWATKPPPKGKKG